MSSRPVAEPRLSLQRYAIFAEIDQFQSYIGRYNIEIDRVALAVKALLARCGRMTDGDDAQVLWPGIPGEMARRVRAFDWSSTPLGPATRWPEGLRAVVGLVLASPIVATIALLDERLLIYNDAAAGLYGERHPRALGQPLALAFADSYDTVADLYDRVFAGETVVVRAQPLAVGTDAGDEVFDAYLTPVRAAGGSVIGAHMIGLEIGERLRVEAARSRAEAALREREADLARVQEIGAVGGVKIEINDELRSWRSPEYLRLHGLRPGTLSETHEDWRARVVPEDRAGAERALFEALESDVTAYENEYRIVRPSDGAVRWIHARADIERAPDGKPIRLVGAHIDVTEQKRAQEALREGEVRQAFIVTLSDALRPLTDVVDIKAEATRVLGEHLGAVRAQYWEAELDGDHFHSEGGYAKDAPRLAGQVRARDFGVNIIDAMTTGRTVVVTDVATDPRITKRELAGYDALGVRSCIGVPLVKYGRLVALLGVHRTDPQEWSTDEIALSEETAERTWFAIERARVEAALHESETRQRTLIEGMPQLVWRAAESGEWTWASPQWAEFTGQTDRESSGWGWLAAVHPDDRQSARDAWAVAAERGSLEVDYRICQAGQKECRWFHTRAAPVRDTAGEIIEWLGTSTDIDELRRLQELQKTLLAELQHRVRNILAVIRSMMRRSSEGQESLSDYVQHLEGRLGAMARTQVLLTRAVDARVDLEDMIRDELVAQAADDGAVTLAGPSVTLTPKAAEVLSLAIHELTTNAIKYGALARRSATVTIEWQIEDRAGVPWLKLAWSEAGVAIAGSAPRHQGFGTDLILRRVPYELKGNGTLETRPDGISCTLEFALSNRASILQTDARPGGAARQT